MAYHPIWIEKNHKIGIESQNLISDNMKKWMSNDSVEECKIRFKEAGIQY